MGAVYAAGLVWRAENRPREEVSPAEVREELARILASKSFAKTERLSRFLRFTVNKVLDGQGHQLKEYLLGLEVFDRKESYDPRLEPIVRTEARRLRAKLRGYYEAEGRDDPVRIDFPTGTYAPVFHRRARGAGAASAARRPTIAVLPFANLSGDPANEYFSDGLTEELIHALTQVDAVRVVAWTSSAQFKGKGHDVRRIGERLGVDTVLEGSVRRSGGRLRINAQLINAADGYHLWSGSYDRQARDIFDIQDEISRAMVDTLRVRLTGEPAAPLITRYTADLEAHTLYLKALHHFHQQTPEGLRKSIGYFEEAIVREPNHAPAHVGLAFAYELQGVWSLRPGPEVMPKAEQAAARALAIDDTLAEAHAALAAAWAHYEWDWEGAEREFRRALALHPGHPRPHHAYAMALLAPQGRFEEALREIRRALELDPLSLFISVSVAHALFAARRWDESIEQCRRAIDQDPHYHLAYLFLGQAQEQKRMFPQAIEAYEKARALSGSPLATAALGRCCALAGHKARARRLAQELEQAASRSYVSPLDRAQIFIGLGDRDRAFGWMAKACEDRAGLLTWIGVDARFDTLRGDPRFVELLRKLGLSR